MSNIPATKPLVGILMGSDSDWPIMKAAADVLKEFGVASEAKVISAHRDPHGLEGYVSSAIERGLKVMVCGAGGAAHLAGVTASIVVQRTGDATACALPNSSPSGKQPAS